MSARIDLAHCQFSFMEQKKFFRPNWCSPEGINTVYVFIFLGANFCVFHGHFVICENNFFVNP